MRSGRCSPTWCAVRSRFRRLRGELGTVTAELATAAPAVLAVIALAIAGVMAGAQQVSLEAAAGDSARAAARGDDPAEFAGDASVVLEQHGDIVCAVLQQPAMGGVLALQARSCADARGW